MIYILFGEDEARSRYKLNTLKKNTPWDSLETYDLETDSPEKVMDALDTYSLFDEKSMVIVNHANFLGTGAKKRSSLTPAKKKADSVSRETGKNSLKKLLENFGRRNPEEKTIVYMVPCKSLHKDVKKYFPAAVCLESRPLDEKTVPGLIDDMILERKIHLDPDARDWFVRHAGLNMLHIAGELDKLALFADHITLEDARRLVSAEPTENVFAMTDALFEKRYLDLIALYRQFRQSGMEPLAVNGLLAGQIRFVFQVRTLMDLRYTQNEIAEKLHVSGGRVFYTMKKARRFQAARLLGLLDCLAQLDYRIKSGLVDKDEGFEDFFMQMMSQEKSRHA